MGAAQHHGLGDSRRRRRAGRDAERAVADIYRRPNIGHYGRNLKSARKVENFADGRVRPDRRRSCRDARGTAHPRLRGSIGVEARLCQHRRRAGRDCWGRTGATSTSSPCSARRNTSACATSSIRTNGVRARIAVEPGVTFGDTTIALHQGSRARQRLLEPRHDKIRWRRCAARSARSSDRTARRPTGCSSPAAADRCAAMTTSRSPRATSTTT